MAFIPYMLNEGGHPPFEYIPASAMEVKLGMALIVEGGKLTAVSGGELPQYFCLTNKVCEDGEIIPVQKLEDGVDYETTATVALSEADVGKKLTIAADSLGVTATDGGHAQLISIAGTEVGAKCVVRFN